MAWAPGLANAGLFVPTPLKERGSREWPCLLWEAEQPSLRKDQPEMGYLRWPRAVPTKTTPL